MQKKENDNFIAERVKMNAKNELLTKKHPVNVH